VHLFVNFFGKNNYYDYDTGTALLLPVNPRIKTMAPRTPVISIVIYALLPAMVNPLYSSMNQQLFERSLCNQSSHYENYR